MTDTDPRTDVRRRAGWLPEQGDLEGWLADLCERAEAHHHRPLHPAVAQFRDLIESDPVVRMYVHQMIEQIPSGRRYTRRHLRSVEQMLRLIDEVLTIAPEFSEDAMVMTPIGAVLDYTMGTPAGFAAWRDRRINTAIGTILDAWGEFLNGPGSRYVLTDSPTGWKSERARQAVGMHQFEHDPSGEHWGFASWNDFFTRRFKDGERPVAAPGDDAVVVAACESTPYGLTTDVQMRSRFWIKSQPYSLQDMLAGDASAERFVGGTVFQAFLSATNYHRWHSPVSGTVVRAFKVPGTYYSEADSEGRAAVEPQNSQSYLAHVAARAVIVLEADNPDIGLLAVVQVGMADVSTCVIDPDLTPGRHVDKGDELGHFQFGGSTHCLVFQAGVIADFALDAVPQPHDADPPLVRVRSRLATVRSRDRRSSDGQ